MKYLCYFFLFSFFFCVRVFPSKSLCARSNNKTIDAPINKVKLLWGTNEMRDACISICNNIRLSILVLRYIWQILITCGSFSLSVHLLVCMFVQIHACLYHFSALCGATLFSQTTVPQKSVQYISNSMPVYLIYTQK